MNFLPYQPSKRCTFTAPEKNKRQTIVVMPHTTLLDVLAAMGLPADYSWQMVYDDHGVELKYEIYGLVETNETIRLHRHSKAPPLTAPVGPVV